MRKILLVCFSCLTLTGFAQEDTAKWLRAFPITAYMVELNDSVKLVQVEMPEGTTVPEGQMAYIYGVYRKGREDAVLKGYGKCRLIKGNYYYFSIGSNSNNQSLQEGDLLYTFTGKSSVYADQLMGLATHYIQLLNVYDNPLYDRYRIFSKWTEADEKVILDSMVADIQLTGNYFIQQDPSMNKPINEGRYNGRKVLDLMSQCKLSELKEFLDYMIARPRLYAGKQWKISEIFATWLSEGAPMVVKK